MYEAWFFAKDLHVIVDLVKKVEAFKAEDLSRTLSEMDKIEVELTKRNV